MKKLIMIIALVATTLTASAGDKKKAVKTVTFDVSMHCENCQKKIEGTIGWEKGVKDLKTNLKEKTVTISYDANKTTPEKLQKSIQKLGYQAQQKPLNEKK
jgi:copper chaperone CopZ